MIRLQRVGRKNEAIFRLVVTEKQNGPKSGRFLELLGSYNPKLNEINFKKERIEHWLSHGAQPSDTVHNLFVKEGIIKGEKKNVLPKKTPIVKEGEEEEKVEETPQKETESTEEISTEAEEEKPVEEKKEEE